MRRFLLTVLALGFAAVAQAEVFSIGKFGGLNTDDSELTLKDQTPDSENVVTDDGPGLSGRLGSVKTSTVAFSQGPWEFPLSNGTKYIIGRSGNNLVAGTDGINFGTLVSTVTASALVDIAVLGDRFYFIDTTAGLKYWNASSVTVASATLTGSMLEAWKGRLAVSGIAAAGRVIYLSEYLVGSNFTVPTDPVDTDPAIITVSGALDESITGLYSSFQDKLMWFKRNSFGALYGTRRSNFTQYVFSDHIGAIGSQTVQDCDGKLRWLGTDRTAWEFNGTGIIPISEENDTLFDTIGQGDSASRTQTITSQSDWAAGSNTATAISTTAYAGDLAFLPWTAYDNWNDGQYTSAPAWTVSSGVWAVSSSALRSSPASTSTDLIYSTSTAITGAWSLSVRQSVDGTGDGETFTWYFTSDTAASSFDNSYQLLVQDAGADFTVRLYKRVASVLTALTSAVSVGTQDTSSHKVKITRSSAGVIKVTWDGTEKLTATDTSLTSSTNTALSTDGKAAGTQPVWIFDDYLRSTDDLNDTTIAVSTTAVHTTAAFSTSGGSAWGPVTLSASLSGATARYEVGTGAGSDSSVFSNWATVTTGGTPTATLSTYAAFRVIFNAPSATCTARVSDLTATWVEGSTIPLASAYINQRYWLACAIGSTANNRVLVYDKNEEWQRYSGMAIDTLGFFRSTPYFGNSAGLYQAETGFTDNGTAIAAYYRTPALAPNGFDLYNRFDSIYLTADRSDSTISTSFRINGDETENSLGNFTMNQGVGFQNVKVPFYQSEVQQGKYLGLKWSVSGTDFWRLVNANVYFQRVTVPQ